jgi:hypothetical protein
MSDGGRTVPTVSGPEQQPEPVAGGRLHEKSGAASVDTHATVEAELIRGMNADRITLLSVLVGVAFTIAFGISGLSWWQRVLAFVLSLAGTALGLHTLFSHERSTHQVMTFAHWVLGHKL